MSPGPEPSAWHRAFEAAVAFFRWDLYAAYRAEATHVPDELGQCAGCHTQRQSTPWPCVVVACAQRAIREAR